MKRFSKTLAAMLILAITVMVAIPAFAAPGNFDFVGGTPPIDDGATIDTELVSDVVFEVENTTATGNLSYDWYLWAGATPGMIGEEIDTLSFNFDDPDWSATLPAGDVNALADGDYSWTIYATDDDDAMMTEIDNGPFTFTIDLVEEPVEGFDFVEENPVEDGSTFTELFTEDIEFEVTDPGADTDQVGFWLFAGDAIAGPVVASFMFTDSDPNWTGTLEADVLNNIGQGEFTWSIYAHDSVTNVWTEIDNGPFSFTIDAENPVRIDPANGDTVDSSDWADFTFEDNGASWYNLYIGLVEEGVYNQSIYKWYDASVICDEEDICTIPVEDTYYVQLTAMVPSSGG
jgi:hypothetical protein